MAATRMVGRLMVATAAALLGVAALPTPTSAHTELDFTLPTDGASVGEPLDEVVVAFREPVTLVGNGFAVLDPQNNELAPFAVTDDDIKFRLQFDPPLAGGAVAVKYEVRAVDGHVISGSFMFTVDAPVPTTTTTTATTSTTTVPTATTAAPSTPSTLSSSTAATDAPTTTSAPPDSTAATNPEPGSSVAAGDDEGGSSTEVILVIAAAIVLGAIGLVFTRSRNLSS